ncbi:MAG TPA: hypothetical protein VFE61_09455, partial [Candidatus Sulfotelmatobacter sp.]|nr:hypothetical protein [Candidatus Sulfotelmatobacter sp.]
IFLLCLATAVLTFFIVGLLYRLCFEHVDNLGAYSIPSETGLLIPSDCNTQETNGQVCPKTPLPAVAMPWASGAWLCREKDPWVRGAGR